MFSTSSTNCVSSFARPRLSSCGHLAGGGPETDTSGIGSGVGSGSGSEAGAGAGSGTGSGAGSGTASDRLGAGRGPSGSPSDASDLEPADDRRFPNPNGSLGFLAWALSFIFPKRPFFCLGSEGPATASSPPPASWGVGCSACPLSELREEVRGSEAAPPPSLAAAAAAASASLCSCSCSASAASIMDWDWSWRTSKRANRSCPLAPKAF
mmetsp:Transcript_105607/g.182097  ORF Transcript_105607/g.182097 Transcript_105607/m.182097 type:complete len:210 (-) Transcript_105607:1380-2009(-)